MAKTKYLVVGTGGVGGSIAGFMALAGYDVSCIARGEQLTAIQERGLILKSDLKGEHVVPVKAFSDAEYDDKADVIFVCIKQYSLSSIKDILLKASHKDTVVIPILNGYGVGQKLKDMLPGIKVLDGCIYIVGFISGPGEVTQMGKVFKLLFGTIKGCEVDPGILNHIADELASAGIKVQVSDDIDRDTFTKWSFISAMACSGAYFDSPMGEIQKDPEKRALFEGLSRESVAVGNKLGVNLPEGIVEYNLSVLDKLDPLSTASMQKDLKKGKSSEINSLLFDFIDLGDKLGVSMPVYREVGKKLAQYKN